MTWSHGRAAAQSAASAAPGGPGAPGSGRASRRLQAPREPRCRGGTNRRRAAVRRLRARPRGRFSHRPSPPRRGAGRRVRRPRRSTPSRARSLPCPARRIQEPAASAGRGCAPGTAGRPPAARPSAVAAVPERTRSTPRRRIRRAGRGRGRARGSVPSPGSAARLPRPARPPRSGARPPRRARKRLRATPAAAVPGRRPSVRASGRAPVPEARWLRLVTSRSPAGPAQHARARKAIDDRRDVRAERDQDAQQHVRGEAAAVGQRHQSQMLAEKLPAIDCDDRALPAEPHAREEAARQQAVLDARGRRLRRPGCGAGPSAPRHAERVEARFAPLASPAFVAARTVAPSASPRARPPWSKRNGSGDARSRAPAEPESLGIRARFQHGAGRERRSGRLLRSAHGVDDEAAPQVVDRVFEPCQSRLPEDPADPRLVTRIAGSSATSTSTPSSVVPPSRSATASSATGRFRLASPGWRTSSTPARAPRPAQAPGSWTSCPCRAAARGHRSHRPPPARRPPIPRPPGNGIVSSAPAAAGRRRNDGREQRKREPMGRSWLPARGILTFHDVLPAAELPRTVSVGSEMRSRFCFEGRRPRPRGLPSDARRTRGPPRAEGARAARLSRPASWTPGEKAGAPGRRLERHRGVGERPDASRGAAAQGARRRRPRGTLRRDGPDARLPLGPKSGSARRARHEPTSPRRSRRATRDRATPGALRDSRPPRWRSPSPSAGSRREPAAQAPPSARPCASTTARS